MAAGHSNSIHDGVFALYILFKLGSLFVVRVIPKSKCSRAWRVGATKAMKIQTSILRLSQDDTGKRRPVRCRILGCGIHRSNNGVISSHL